jgi:tRNA pseudouridine38-40 synthase
MIALDKGHGSGQVLAQLRTIKLTIEYDGTSYAGWQIQPNGIAVQQVVEEALYRLLKQPVRLFSSGRTDAGVHARGMVASFATDKAIPLQAFREGLNALLPHDIAVRLAEEANSGFNPRFDAQGKHYRYTIYNARIRSPLSRLYVWHLPVELDLERMRQAAFCLVGEHDFAAFRTAGCAAKTTVRRIFSVEVAKDGELILIDVKGSGFLKNMVRIIAGTLVAVGMGKLAPEYLAQLLSDPQAGSAGATAPARGLCLMEVYF